jgi:hypothetical protein
LHIWILVYLSKLCYVFPMNSYHVFNI